MKAFKPLIILLFTCSQTLCIFSQSNTVLNYLPEDAKMIIKINPASLGQKVKWEELLKSKMFADLIKEAGTEGKEFLKNPAQSGVDLSQGIYVLIPANKNNKKPEPVLYGITKDTAQFASMVKKLTPGKRPVKTGNGKLIIDKNTAIAWNNEIFILTGNTQKQVTSATAKQVEAAELTRAKQLTERCKTLLKKRQTPFNNASFKSVLMEEGDVYLWINNNVQVPVQKKKKSPEILEMLSKNIMRSGNYTSGIVKFENGKVSMQMKRYISASLDSVYKKYPLKNINTELLKKLPAGQPIFLYSFSFSPEMINEMFVKAGADKYIDSISKKKIKMADIVPAIKGDASLAVVKVYEFTEEDSVTQAMNGLQLFLAGSINDKEKFKNLNALLQKQKEDTAKNIPAKKMKPFIFFNDSIFVVSLSQIAAQKFLASPGNNEDMAKLIEPYKNYTGAFIIDLKTIFGFAMQPMLKNKSEEEAKQASAVLNMFEKVVSYGGQYDNQSLSSTTELILADRDENSLKQFINLLEVFYKMGNKKSTTSDQSLPDEEMKQ